MAVISGEIPKKRLSEIAMSHACSRQAIHARVMRYISDYKSINPGQKIPDNLAKSRGILDRDIPKNLGPEKFVRAVELGKMFSPAICERTIRYWQTARFIPFYKMGRSVLFNPEEVFAHMKKCHRIRPK